MQGRSRPRTDAGTRFRAPGGVVWRCVLTLALLWPCFAASDDSITLTPRTEQVDKSGHELAQLRQQIAEHRQHLESLADEEHAEAEKLEYLVQEMGLVKNLLASLDERERILTLQSDELQVQLVTHQGTYEAQQEVLARRLRALYVRGSQRNIELILTADSFSSLVTRLKYVTIMARFDGGLIAQTREQGQAIVQKQRQLQSALAGLWEAREEARLERRRLELMDEERRALLEDLQFEKELAQQRLKDLQAREKKVKRVLSDLERVRIREIPAQPAGEGPFAREVGNLAWPVSGEILQPFGRSVHPEFQTVTIHNGISIAAPRGAPVYAVAVGAVEFADYLPGFGECVILDHGAGYYSLYAHLDRIFVSKNTPVSRGEILAEVGEAPSDGLPQLYFELRQGKTPLDPMPWLQPRRP